MIKIAFRRRSSKLKSCEQRLLTPLVLRKAGRLSKLEKDLFNIWRNTGRMERLPNGTPYKVTDNCRIRFQVGEYVRGLNQPLIIVSDLLTESERRSVARHELIEWERAYSEGAANRLAHKSASSRENQLQRKEALLTGEWFQGVFTMMGNQAQNMTRKDYLKWRDSEAAVKEHGPRKKRRS